MARAGRKRKLDAVRFKSGQIKKEDDAPSPTLVKRASLMALVGLCDASYGTMPGVFYLSRKIDAYEYEAAKRFGELYGSYLTCVGGPKPPGRQNLERGHGQAPIDVDSAAGEREASRQIDILSRYNDAHMALKIAGFGIEDELIRFCHGPGQTPAGWEGMIRVRKGLSALSVLWKVRIK